MKPTKQELKIAIKVLKYFDKKLESFPEEAKEDESYNEWSVGFMHVLDVLEQRNPESYIDDYLNEWKASNDEEQEAEQR